MRYGIILIIAGLLAAPQLIAGRNKSSDDLLKQVQPYQGWLGAVLFVWGVWDLIQFLVDLDIFLLLPMFWFALIIATIALEIILGGLLGYNLIHKYALSKNAAAAEKGKMLHKKLAAKQKFFGILGIMVGIIMIVIDLAYR